MLALWPALWALWRLVTSGQNDDIRHAWADEQDDDDEVEEESFDEERDEGKGVAQGGAAVRGMLRVSLQRTDAQHTHRAILVQSRNDGNAL